MPVESDRLYLLKPFFADPGVGPGVFHCPASARVEGLLAFYPFLRARVEVRYLDFPRPRAVLVELLGADNQSCPVLVPAGANAAVPGGATSEAGVPFFAGADAISWYLSQVHGIPLPHP